MFKIFLGTSLQLINSFVASSDFYKNKSNKSLIAIFKYILLKFSNSSISALSGIYLVFL